MPATHTHFAKPAEVCSNIPWSHCYSDAATCPCWWQSQDWQNIPCWFYGYVCSLWKLRIAASFMLSIQYAISFLRVVIHYYCCCFAYWNMTSATPIVQDRVCLAQYFMILVYNIYWFALRHDFSSVILLKLYFFIDVVSIPKTNENFRLLYDTKGRFRLHSVRDDEAKVLLVGYVEFFSSFPTPRCYYTILCGFILLSSCLYYINLVLKLMLFWSIDFLDLCSPLNFSFET